MRRAAIWVGLLAIAGCGTSVPRMPAQLYQEPTGTPAAPPAKVVSLPTDAAAAQVLAGLKDANLTQEHVDLSRGIVVATYSGDPEGFVDCGTVQFGRGGRSVPASRQSMTVNELAGGAVRGGSVARDLRLDTRMVIAAQPFGSSTSISVDAEHVLSKTVQVGDQVVRTESIAFDGQGEGYFRKGTDCLSTGRLEQLALASVPGPLVTLATPPGQQLARMEPPPVQQASVSPMAASAAPPLMQQTALPQPSAADSRATEQQVPAQQAWAPPPAAVQQATASPGLPQAVVTPPATPALQRSAKRVALVVGNAAYEHAEPLANPINDSRAIAAALRRLGFVVVEGTDEDKAGMQTLLRQFYAHLQDADASLFFYAGHGLQVDRQNYLVPVDAVLQSEVDLPFEAVAVDQVLGLMEQKTPMRLVFLDACRDNPLARRLARSLGQSRSFSVGQGLARMNSRVGTLIAFATEPDEVALDGTGGHSPFAAALLQHIETPGLEVRQLLSRVRATVIKSTDGQQLPLDTSALIEDFYFVQTRA